MILRKRAAGVAQTLATPFRHGAMAVPTAVRFLFLGVLGLGVVGQARAQQGPDLTATNLSAINTTSTYNLGPTGMRGWIYVPYPGGTLQNEIAQQDRMTSFAPYQILVTAVGTNTPAYGVFATNDVILCVSTGFNNLPVPPFTNDTRKSLGWAIGAAEAGDGWLNLKRWRAGVTNDVSIRLPLQGLAYSARRPTPVRSRRSFSPTRLMFWPKIPSTGARQVTRCWGWPCWLVATRIFSPRCRPTRALLACRGQSCKPWPAPCRYSSRPH